MINLQQQQLDDLKQLLTQRELALQEDIRREADMKDDYSQIASEVPDPGDASFANLSVDLENAALTRDLHELQAIQRARSRIEKEVYGECIECGFEIPFERLSVQPAAERCAPCQDMYEKTHADAMKGVSL